MDNEELSQFVEQIAGMDASEAKVACERLRDMDPQAATELVRLAISRVSTKRRRRIMVTLAIARCDVAVDPICETMLSDPAGDVRALAAWALMQIGDLSAVPSLAAVLSDPCEDVVTTACTAIGHIMSRKAIGTISGLLSHPSWQIRLHAVAALLQLGIRDSKIVEALSALSDTHEAIEHDRCVAEGRQMEKRFGVDEETAGGEGALRTMQELLDDARRIAGPSR